MDAFTLEQATKLQSKIINLEGNIKTLETMLEKISSETDCSIAITLVGYGHSIRETDKIRNVEILREIIPIYKNRLEELQVAFKEL